MKGDLLLNLSEKISTLETQSNYCGLYHGLAGLTIANFLFANIYGSQTHVSIAHTFLNTLSKKINALGDQTFENGIAGIGWTVEWITQNNFLDANSDEILEDIDDELYKSVVYLKSNDPSLATGLLGQALYHYRRCIAKNSDSNRFRNLCHRECLILLIDEIKQILFTKNIGSLSNGYFFPLCQFTFFLVKIFRSSIRIPSVEETIDKSLAIIRTELKEPDAKSGIYSINHIDIRLYALYVFHEALAAVEDTKQLSFIKKNITLINQNFFTKWSYPNFYLLKKINAQINPGKNNEPSGNRHKKKSEDLVSILCELEFASGVSTDWSEMYLI